MKYEHLGLLECIESASWQSKYVARHLEMLFPFSASWVREMMDWWLKSMTGVDPSNIFTLGGGLSGTQNKDHF